MSHRAFLLAALSTCVFACFAKTTSLGSATDPVEETKEGGAQAAADVDAQHAVDAAVKQDASGSGNACQIAASGLPVAPCPNGELGVGAEYCRSDNGTCGGPAHCVSRPPPPPPFCAGMECGCDGVVRCLDYSRPLGYDVGPKAVCGITCGPKNCDGLTEYCWHGTGGVMTPDGGASTMYDCRPIPTACAIDHSCTCLMANGGAGGQCAEQDGKLDLNVPLP